VSKLILLFVILPLVETYLLAHIGAAIGWENTIVLVIVTGVLGGWLAKLEGARAWHRWQAALAAGTVPEEGVLEGLLLLIGGVLLITPGVLTDAAGLVLLIPMSRRLVAGFIRPRLEERLSQQATTVVEQSRIQVVRFGSGGSVGAWGFDPFEDGATHQGRRRAAIGRPQAAAGAQPSSRQRQSQQVIDAEFEVREPEQD